MTLLCPCCSSALALRKSTRRLPVHHEPGKTKSFARLADSDIQHFFDYRKVCELSGALFKLGKRS